MTEQLTRHRSAAHSAFWPSLLPTPFKLCRRYMSLLLRDSYEVVYQQLPGSYSSAARFVRLRELLKQVGGVV